MQRDYGAVNSIINLNTGFVSHSKSFYVAYLFCANACPTGESVQPALWLQTLMDVCCSAADFSIQAVAISLVMDLVGLTQSAAMVTAEACGKSRLRPANESEPGACFSGDSTATHIGYLEVHCRENQFLQGVHYFLTHFHSFVVSSSVLITFSLLSCRV